MGRHSSGNYTKKSKSKIIIALTIIIIVIIGVSIYLYITNMEKKGPEITINNMFNALKQSDESKVNEYLDYNKLLSSLDEMLVKENVRNEEVEKKLFESIEWKIENIEADGETATATSGGVGGNGSTSGSMGLHGIGGSGGNGGSASGGNTANQPGSRGGTGGSGESESKSQALAQATKGSSVSNNYNGYITKSQGNGNSSNPTSAYAVILRGNTNILLDQRNALDITSMFLNVSELQQMQTDILMGNISVD